MSFAPPTCVEDYIADTYDAAATDERNAVGFVMTVYRRRLASSFFALRKTLEKRRQGADEFLSAMDEISLDEDAADLIEAGEEIDADTVSEEERRALASEEIASIGNLVKLQRSLDGPLSRSDQCLRRRMRSSTTY